MENNDFFLSLSFSRNQYDIYGLGLNKDLVVLKDTENHIIGHNTELIENVSLNGMKRSALFVAK